MLETAATHPSCSESKPENSSGLVSPSPLGPWFVRPHFPPRESWPSLLPCSFSGLVPAFGGLGHYRLLLSQGTWWKNPFLPWKCMSWCKPKQYFPKGSVAWGWLWLDSMAGGQAWVREVQLFFWCAPKTCKFLAAVRVVPGELLCFLQRGGIKTGWAQTGDMFKLSVISNQSESVSEFGVRLCF